MKSSTPLFLGSIMLAASAMAAWPASPHEWLAPGYGDVRGPCPMLNTLANHGYLPHDGENIDENRTVDALYTALNIDNDLAKYLFQKAMTTNPAYPNASTFSLKDLARHDILEHDASLSRIDYYFGNPSPFNQTIFDQTRSYWISEIIDVQQAANARLARVIDSNTTNPTYSMSNLGEAFSYGETGAYIIVLGDKVSGTVRKNVVEYLFENERLPTELGWKRVDETITEGDLVDISERIINATGTSPVTAAGEVERGGAHLGFRHDWAL